MDVPALTPAPSAPAEPAAPSRFRRWLLPALKLLLVGGMVYYIVAYKVTAKQAGGLKTLLLSPYMLGLGLLAFSLQQLICAQRLRMLLAAQGQRLRYRTMLRLTYLGAFFDVFMFTSVGGDAVKAVYLARECPAGKRLEGVSVLVMDRLMGLIGLLALMLLAAGSQFNLLRADPDVSPYLIWILLPPALLFAGTAGLLSESVYSSRPVQTLLKHIPLGGMLGRAYYSLQRFRDCPGVLLKAGGLSLLVHSCGVLGGYILLQGMGGEAQFGPFFVAWFVSNLLCSFLPFQGIGFGQQIYDTLFRSIADVPGGWALATAVQAAFILIKLPGGLAWLVSREHGVNAASRLNRQDAETPRTENS